MLVVGVRVRRQARHVLPDIYSTMPHTLFNYWNYLYTLWPKGYFDADSYPLQGSISRQDWDRFGAELAAQKQNACKRLIIWRLRA